MSCAALLLSSCELFTPAPKPLPPAPVQTQASYDGNKQDSGVILVDSEKGVLVTLRLTERYNVLIDRFGHDTRLAVPVARNEGLTPADPDTALKHADRGAVFWMTRQAFSTFVRMNQWRQAAQTPTQR